MLIPQATQKGYIECYIPGVADMSFPNSKSRRGRVQEGGNICPTLLTGTQIYVFDNPCIAASRGRKTDSNKCTQKLEVNKNGTSNALTTVLKDNYVIEKNNVFQYRIRKLIPLECWKLMGFTEVQFSKARMVNSDSQLYKQAGNSIVVDVLYYIFKNLFK